MARHQDTVKLVELDYLALVAETDKAYGVNEGIDKQGVVWLPKSLVEYDKDNEVFTMPEWLAVDKELV